MLPNKNTENIIRRLHGLPRPDPILENRSELLQNWNLLFKADIFEEANRWTTF